MSFNTLIAALLAIIIFQNARKPKRERIIIMNGANPSLDDILTGVQEESTLEDGVLTLLKNANGDPTKIQAVIDVLSANKAKLSAALTANTPQAEPAGSAGA